MNRFGAPRTTGGPGADPYDQHLTEMPEQTD